MILAGVDFGIYTIADEDWDFMKQICQREGYKSVLEFGCGASTVLFGSHGLTVYSVETDQSCADKVISLRQEHVHVIMARPGILIPDIDFVFIDGPFVSKERDANIMTAGNLPGVKGVILHDSHEPWIIEYGAEHLAKKGFTQVEFGGSVYTAEPPGTAPFEGRFRCTHWYKP
jgi:hypothetical protein